MMGYENTNKLLSFSQKPIARQTLDAALLPVEI